MLKPKLDILIVNFNTSSLLDGMFSALTASDWSGSVRYLVVDNASTDDSVDNLRSNYPQALLVENDRNVGFGRANNCLLDYLQGDYALLLNTDAFVSPDTLSKTLSFMIAHPDCGVLGVRLIGRDGSLQPSCRFFPTPFNVFLSRTRLIRLFPWVRCIDDMDWDHGSVRECDWVPGCFYLIRREVINQIGLFDPRFFLYYEEVDHCKRVKAAGWKVLYYPYTSVIHIGGESAKSAGELTSTGRQISALQIESEMLYFRKHYGLHGLAAHMTLTVLGDLILATKAFLKGKGWGEIAANWQHAMTNFRLLRQTRLAIQPTR